MTVGQVNDHRIVRAPAKAGSYADVSILLADGALAQIRLEYIGGELYGRTALTPTRESLEAVIHGVSSQAAASILQDIAEVGLIQNFGCFSTSKKALAWHSPALSVVLA